MDRPPKPEWPTLGNNRDMNRSMLISMSMSELHTVQHASMESQTHDATQDGAGRFAACADCAHTTYIHTYESLLAEKRVAFLLGTT